MDAYGIADIFLLTGAEPWLDDDDRFSICMGEKDEEMLLDEGDLFTYGPMDDDYADFTGTRAECVSFIARWNAKALSMPGGWAATRQRKG